MPEFYDALETRDPETRERALMGALPRQIALAKAKARGWARILSEVDPAGITGRAALAKLPVTRKPDLIALQKAEPHFGGLNATPVAQLGRIFVSPGPIYDPAGRGRDWGRAARALFAAGFSPGGGAPQNLAYPFTPAGAMRGAGGPAPCRGGVPGGNGTTGKSGAGGARLRA